MPPAPRHPPASCPVATRGQRVQIVEIGRHARVADLVDSREVTAQPERAAEPVLLELVGGRDRSQLLDEVAEPDPAVGPRASGIVTGSSSIPRISARRLDREQVRLAAPLQVGHVVRLRCRRGERGVEHELVAQREHEVVVLHRLEVHGHAAAAFVDVVQAPHVAVMKNRCRAGGTPRGPSSGSPMCASSTSRTARTRPAFVVELPGVPHHHRLPSARVDRVPGQPREAELEERIRVGASSRGSTRS